MTWYDRAREIAAVVKDLLYKQGDLCLTLEHTFKKNLKKKKLSMVAHTCNLSSGEAEIGRSVELTGQPS